MFSDMLFETPITIDFVGYAGDNAPYIYKII